MLKRFTESAATPSINLLFPPQGEQLQDGGSACRISKRPARGSNVVARFAGNCAGPQATRVGGGAKPIDQQSRRRSVRP